jgi:tetratricopeptide (TPR) repeat protein
MESIGQGELRLLREVEAGVSCSHLFPSISMIIPLPALAAYRRDLEALGDFAVSEPELERALGRWVSFGAILESFLGEVTPAAQENGADAVQHVAGIYAQRLADVAADDRDPPADSTSTAPSAAHPNELSGLATLTRQVAAAAEQRGALWLAYMMLATLERVGDAMPPLELGRALAQRARVARKADSSDVADTLYRRVDALGRSAHAPELTARAAMGFGVLAQFRGNLPLAARHFGKAARIAASTGDADLRRLAQHGRMVIAARRGAFADALSFGWDAFAAAAGNREQEADMLLNLAQIALDTGHAAPALQGFAAALARRPGPRLLLPALGGAARAAAALNRMEVVHWCGLRIEEIAREGSFAYPTASALLDLALATAAKEPTTSERYVRRALRLTDEFRFHELEHHLVGLQTRLEDRAVPTTIAAPPSQSIGARGDEVLRQIEQLEGELLQTTA